MRSAMISEAPASACSAFSTPFSPSIYFAASAAGSGQSGDCAYKISASGSKPFSFATVARVRRFCLYGRYKSSTSASVCAPSICAESSSVNFPWFSIEVFTSCLRASRLRKYCNLSASVRMVWSSIVPCISLRYRAIKGTVFPSSRRVTTFCTYSSFFSNSFERICTIVCICTPYNFATGLFYHKRAFFSIVLSDFFKAAQKKNPPQQQGRSYARGQEHWLIRLPARRSVK